MYGDELPERGGISVYLNDAEDTGVTGVIGQVLTLVTDAGANGFHGLGGRHVRSRLLHYAQGDVAGVRFKRNDTGDEVEVEIDASTVTGDPMMRPLMQLTLTGQANVARRREFGRL